MTTWTDQEQAAPPVSADQFLNIGAGFNLLIATTHKLIIQPSTSGTVWAEQNQS